MIEKDLINFLNENILLKNEELNLLDVKQYNRMMDIPIIKRTTRTRRTVAMLTIGFNDKITPDAYLLKLFTSPKTKKKLKLTNDTYEWIKNGLVIREFRFGKDELTVLKEQYRMGFNLYRQIEKLKKKRQKEQTEHFLQWSKKWNEIKAASTSEDPKRIEDLDKLKELLDDVTRNKEFTPVMPKWQFNKRLLYLHFLAAFYQISMVENHFDWKEIGARYYREIGGSKAFDLYKAEFIDNSEEMLDSPLHIFGLRSLGTITPIYFVGKMASDSVSYDYGTIHATTDLAVFTEHFHTDAKVLWLVENRGILTRMAFEMDFLTNTQSLILGIDGQLRASHRRLIKQLLTNVEQAIIWTDVDEAGLIIGSHLAELIQRYEVVAKWVVPELEVVSRPGAFKSAFEQALEIRSTEQEEQIGGIERWKNWVNH